MSAKQVLVASHDQRYVTVQCCTCLIRYAIPEELDKLLLERREAMSTSCPNGDRWHYVTRKAEPRDPEADDGRQACPVCGQRYLRLATHQSRMRHWRLAAVK